MLYLRCETESGCESVVAREYVSHVCEWYPERYTYGGQAVFSSDRFYDMFREAEINENAYEDWCEYREQVTDFIVKSVRKDSTAAVYGAGRCCDLDLKRLAECFSTMVLYDYDEKAMKDALKLYGLREGKNAVPTGGIEHVCEIRLMQADFTGMERESYIRFTDHFHYGLKNIKTEQDADDFRRELLAIIRNAYADAEKKRARERVEAAADYSIALGLHSQLNNSFSAIWNYVAGAVAGLEGLPEIIGETVKKTFTDIETEQRKNTQRIVNSVNTMISENTRDSIFIGYELYVKTMPGSPIEGAYNCSHDLEEREKNGEIQTVSYIRTEWPLAIKRELVYDMVVGKFKKK